MKSIIADNLQGEPKIKNYFDTLKRNNIDVKSVVPLSCQKDSATGKKPTAL